MTSVYILLNKSAKKRGKISNEINVISQKSMRGLMLLIMAAMLGVSCGTSSFSMRDKPTSAVKINHKDVKIKRGVRVLEKGMASWYGPDFHGKSTANGEVYNMNGYTAAHRTLPFGSEVIVHNKDNNKKVRVRINDRGPFAKNRIIDLSKSAANYIGMIGPGTARVDLYLAKGNLKNSNIKDLTKPSFTIQLGSYTKKSDAERLSNRLKGSRIAQATVGNRIYYRVYYGIYDNEKDAQKAHKKLGRKWRDGFIKQIENH